MTKVAISQSNFIPWKGYFDNIASVDVFVLYDEVQYTKRDWRNRNKIQTSNGLKWLTIPVEVKGKYFQKISETNIVDESWKTNHVNLIKQNYSKALCYQTEIEKVIEWYSSSPSSTISEVNRHFIEHVCNYLGIKTKILCSSQFEKETDDKTERLVEICESLKASAYYSGPAAKAYMNHDLFNKKNIEVKYYSYEGYKEYNQVFSPFEHGVSILDLILNVGARSREYLKF